MKRLQPRSSEGAEADEEEADLGDGKNVKLTLFTHGLGCACKLRPQALQAVLHALPQPTDPMLLVGTNTGDDAAVYQGREPFFFWSLF